MDVLVGQNETTRKNRRLNRPCFYITRVPFWELILTHSHVSIGVLFLMYFCSEMDGFRRFRFALFHSAGPICPKDTSGCDFFKGWTPSHLLKLIFVFCSPVGVKGNL